MLTKITTIVMAAMALAIMVTLGYVAVPIAVVSGLVR